MLSNKLKKSKQEGFTIIEVMIVLAIAGLIMLVVFLAVPTLQRNQRNSGRRADASRLASAANDFVTNANGTTPASAGDGTTILTSAGTLSNLGGSTGTLAGGYAATCTATSLTKDALTVCASPVAGVSFTTLLAGEDGVVLATKAQCGTSGGSVVKGSARQMAIVYTVESGGAPTLACLNI